jgi:hypothetical protein
MNDESGEICEAPRWTGHAASDENCINISVGKPE